MKRLFCHACAMLAVLIVMSMFTVVNASAANGTTIDTTNAKYGFVTVNYASNVKLKVGIQYGSEKTSYKNCPSGKDAVFSLEQGDGTYTISLCENISGTTYRVVTSKRVNAKIENAYAPYLIATTDVQFTSGDDVCKKAAELCKDAKTDMDKVTAIYNYIAGHYTYDTKLAGDITSGKVSKYIPDTAATLNSNKGICYDLASLFAAMCRSQDHPLRPHQGLRRQQLPRLEQGQRQRQLVPDRHDLCRHQARHQRDHLRWLRLPPDLLPAERRARRVRGGVRPHNSSKDGGRYSLPPFFLRGISSVNIIFENRLAFLGKSGIL